MSNPTVSIIIPTYNRSDIIIRAIESVLNQTYKDFELIIGDDHSTDFTKEVVESCLDPRVIYYKKQRKKKGQAAMINDCAKIARGKYIAFLDDDDEWLPNKLELQMECFKNNPKAILVHSGFNMIRNGKKIYSGGNNIYGKRSTEEVFNYNGICMITAVVKKDIFDKEPWDEDIGSVMDRDFFIRVSKWGEFEYCPEKLVNINLHGNNISSNNRLKIESERNFIRKHYKTIKELNLLGKHYFGIGVLNILDGNTELAKEMFRISIDKGYNSIQVKTYYYLSLVSPSLLKILITNVFPKIKRWLKDER